MATFFNEFGSACFFIRGGMGLYKQYACARLVSVATDAMTEPYASYHRHSLRYM